MLVLEVETMDSAWRILLLPDWCCLLAADYIAVHEHSFRLGWIPVAYLGGGDAVAGGFAMRQPACIFGSIRMQLS